MSLGQSATWAEQFPKHIVDPWGPTYVLAANEAEALRYALDQWGDDEVEKVVAAGWMCEVAYPDGYGSREEWEQSLDFTEHWWEGCAAPVNDRQRAVRAWEVVRV